MKLKTILLPQFSTCQVSPIESILIQLDDFDFGAEYKYQEELFPNSEEHPIGTQWALIHFETPIPCPPKSMIIGSKLDTDIRIYVFLSRMLLNSDGHQSLSIGILWEIIETSR